jgi:hypothetical protein
LPKLKARLHKEKDDHLLARDFRHNSADWYFKVGGSLPFIVVDVVSVAVVSVDIVVAVEEDGGGREEGGSGWGQVSSAT